MSRSAVLCIVPLGVMLLMVPVLISAQTYDTPSTLRVYISNPIYKYVDADGYTTVTGTIHNESNLSYVGNVAILVQFYGSTGDTPLYSEISTTSLQVIPPKSTSPFSIRSPEPDIRIVDAIPSILIFEQADPKPLGLYTDMDIITGNVTVSDVAHSPHTNVTIHVTYRDVFEPPRILRVDTYMLGDMDMDNTLQTNIYGNMPYNTKSIAIHAESDVFSSYGIERSIFYNAAPSYPDSYITDVWIYSDDTRTTLLTIHENVTLGAGVHLDTNNTHWLYMQIKPQDDSTIIFLERAQIQSPDVEVVIPWTPLDIGDYILEVFLRSGLDTPISVPGPILLFAVE
ncbi:MAG: hypothetical protein F4Z11_04405 [Cenarchaeum sp. SB0666_bin_15]|nr:hypothetical protein [Cenarchaeum sp. SB0664_bin_35]MXZ93728.1 hypothetical protein [Cenarchaeum sp. SB0666_bin_15]MYB46859.1 hypothetical protein [Cenarchaeum sp. SB0662_bin_33]MYJ27188.1 hypothetical protein [Cenarchaeum sp. SB0672_bin_9]